MCLHPKFLKCSPENFVLSSINVLLTKAPDSGQSLEETQINGNWFALCGRQNQIYRFWNFFGVPIYNKCQCWIARVETVIQWTFGFVFTYSRNFSVVQVIIQNCKPTMPAIGAFDMWRNREKPQSCINLVQRRTCNIHRNTVWNCPVIIRQTNICPFFRKLHDATVYLFVKKDITHWAFADICCHKTLESGHLIEPPMGLHRFWVDIRYIVYT